MSEVKRFSAPFSQVNESSDGLYIHADDYDAAQSELSALREDLVKAKEEIAVLADDNFFHQTDCRRVKRELKAAEQRNSELVELLDSAFFRLDTFIEAEREMPIPSMEVLRDAILRHCPTLKPVDPGPIQIDCGECPNITDCCHGSCMKANPTESGASE